MLFIYTLCKSYNINHIRYDIDYLPTNENISITAISYNIDKDNYQCPCYSVIY